MLRRVFKVKQGMVWFRSGHFYTFKYKNFQNDPRPTILALYAVKGTHPNTGHVHNYLQAINFTYIPRAYRKQFMKIWKPILERYKGNTVITWEIIKRSYPFMQVAVRRYLLDQRLITEHKEIPPDELDAVVVSTWDKDYSKQVLMSMLSKYNKVQTVVRRASPFSGRNAFGPKGLFGGGRKT